MVFILYKFSPDFYIQFLRFDALWFQILQLRAMGFNLGNGKKVGVLSELLLAPLSCLANIPCFSRGIR